MQGLVVSILGLEQILTEFGGCASREQTFGSFRRPIRLVPEPVHVNWDLLQVDETTIKNLDDAFEGVQVGSLAVGVDQ